MVSKLSSRITYYANGLYLVRLSNPPPYPVSQEETVDRGRPIDRRLGSDGLYLDLKSSVYLSYTGENRARIDLVKFLFFESAFCAVLPYFEKN